MGLKTLDDYDLEYCITIPPHTYGVKRLCQGGIQYIFHFENGYGASVIQHDYSYGHQYDLWEVAVLKQTDDKWNICYDSGLTRDVIGCITENGVEQVLSDISTVTEDDFFDTHDITRYWDDQGSEDYYDEDDYYDDDDYYDEDEDSDS